MRLYYDKEGKPIDDVLQWSKLFEDSEYRKIKQEKLWWRGWLSTVFLGLNHNWGEGEPLIFESMLFSRWGSDLDCQRYSTVEEATLGHQLMKKHWSSPQNFLPIICGGIWSGTKNWLGECKRRLRGFLLGKLRNIKVAGKGEMKKCGATQNIIKRIKIGFLGRGS